MAAEGRLAPFSVPPFDRRIVISGRRCCGPCSQATSCPNARRISPAQQNLILAKSTGKCHQGPTHGAFLPVSLLPSFPAMSVECPSPDIQTCTKSGSFQQSGTSRSWSIWTRGAQGLPRMLCTTTSSTERTRSRHASHLVSFWSRTYPFHRSPLHASNRLLYDRCKLFCNKT